MSALQTQKESLFPLLVVIHFKPRVEIFEKDDDSNKGKASMFDLRITGTQHTRGALALQLSAFRNFSSFYATSALYALLFFLSFSFFSPADLTLFFLQCKYVHYYYEIHKV